MSLTESEREILESIVVASDDDPNRPEFPPDKPFWPSTPTYRIAVPGFRQVYLKDESVNPTGTHKDRMAWEMVVTYKHLLNAKKLGRIEKLPQMSIISSGSAANAIQQMLSRYGLPNLKVVVDVNIDSSIRGSLLGAGCEIYDVDLSASVLGKEDILRITENEDGIDITSDDSLGPYDVFYDWMSYDIINQDARHVFIPYGTGHLFENIVNIAVKEVRSSVHDPRYRGEESFLQQCDFFGATTNNSNSIADKLYSPHRPFVHFDTTWIKMATRNGYIGNMSDVFLVDELLLQDAMTIAKANHVECEPSGIASLALLLQMKDAIPNDDKILIVNTGKTRYK